MHDVVPYDIDNVKIKYLGSNNANAYATGIEFRLFGELVQDAESWLSIGFMRTGENLDNDFYYEYRNAAGEIIGPSTTDQVATDSSRRDVGYVRRPTDRRITVGLYLEDYLPTNKISKFTSTCYTAPICHSISPTVPGTATGSSSTLHTDRHGLQRFVAE